MKLIIAIDPGASGGIAFEIQNALPHAYPIPQTEGDIVVALHELKKLAIEFAAEPICYIEDQVGCVGPGMKVSATAMFTFGRGFGFLLGVLQTQGWRITPVRPQKWQEALSLGSKRACASKTEWKNKLKARAQQLYPDEAVTLKTADALLLLEYAKRKEQL